VVERGRAVVASRADAAGGGEEEEVERESLVGEKRRGRARAGCCGEPGGRCWWRRRGEVESSALHGSRARRNLRGAGPGQQGVWASTALPLRQEVLWLFYKQRTIVAEPVFDPGVLFRSPIVYRRHPPLQLAVPKLGI
jgi:hypothetical protein